MTPCLRFLGDTDVSAHLSPASACGTPFCVGRPALALNLRWIGSSTKRPSARLAAVAPLMIRFVSLIAFVTCERESHCISLCAEACQTYHSRSVNCS